MSIDGDHAIPVFGSKGIELEFADAGSLPSGLIALLSGIAIRSFAPAASQMRFRLLCTIASKLEQELRIKMPKLLVAVEDIQRFVA